MVDEPTISAEDEAELLEVSRELAASLQSPWQPRCIAAAFATPTLHSRHLTMQQWIDLDAIRSPFLLGEIPQDVDEFLAAAQIFALNVSERTPPQDIAVLQQVILRACREAFALALPMQPPGRSEGGEDAGFGDWLPIYTCLVTECGLSPTEVMAHRVDRALATIATKRHNEGWKVGGQPYALRDLNEEDAGNG